MRTKTSYFLEGLASCFDLFGTQYQRPKRKNRLSDAWAKMERKINEKAIEVIAHEQNKTRNSSERDKR